MNAKNSQHIMALILCLVLTLQASAGEPPRLIPFQGVLVDATGRPLPDGLRVAQFQIYGEPTGGSPLWGGEVHRITVNGGLVNVQLGSKNPLPIDRPDDPSRSFFDASLYLQITVDSDANGVINQADPPLLPRQAILPVVFAQDAGNSRKLAGYDWSAILSGGGTNPSLGKLDGSKLSPGSINEAMLAQTLANLLVPTGTVSAFAGDTNAIPQGWLLCNGAAFSSAKHPKLYAAIRTAWGDASEDSDPATDFRVPDCRGLFIRGVALNSPYQDPERDQRDLEAVGGNRGNKVGSYQVHAFERHDHGGNTGEANATGTNPFRDYSDTGGSQNPPAIVYRYDQKRVSNPISQHTHAIPLQGGSETRPFNVYMNYIIKD